MCHWGGGQKFCFHQYMDQTSPSPFHTLNYNLQVGIKSETKSGTTPQFYRRTKQTKTPEVRSYVNTFSLNGTEWKEKKKTVFFISKGYHELSWVYTVPFPEKKFFYFILYTFLWFLRTVLIRWHFNQCKVFFYISTVPNKRSHWECIWCRPFFFRPQVEVFDSHGNRWIWVSIN